MKNTISLQNEHNTILLVYLDTLLLVPTEVINFCMCRKWTLKKFGFDMTMLVCDQVSQPQLLWCSWFVS